MDPKLKQLLVTGAVGLIAGLLASLVVGGSGGLVSALIAGLLGAFVGSYLLGALGVNLGIGNPLVSQVVTATIGAIIVVILARIIA